MEISLNNKNNNKDMDLNDDKVSSQVIIEYIVSYSTISLAIYYSYMTSFAVFTSLILNYLLPELKINTTQVILISIGLLSLWFYPVQKYECESEDKCEQVSMNKLVNDPTKDKLSQIKFKYDTSITKILQILIWAILLSVVFEKLMLKIINIEDIKNKLGLTKY